MSAKHDQQGGPRPAPVDNRGGARMAVESTIEKLVFASRWLQAPMYLGLIVAGVLYCYKFLVELVHLCATIGTITEELLMMGVLTLVDIVMVANLLVMVIVGGWATFVSKLDIADHVDRPDWLDKIDAGTLKIKLAAALVGISGIHLLKSFIYIEHKEMTQVILQIGIHVTFLVSAVMLAWVERIMHPPHAKH